MLDEQEIRSQVSKLWVMHQTDRLDLDRLYGFVQGKLGIPSVPEGASAEVRSLAKLARKNVLSLVRDSFAQNLSVVGYRSATARENSAAWKMWQRNRMDARQSEVYRTALTYGTSYVVVAPSKKGPVFRPRSPRQMIAAYEDPQVDEWPIMAMETWIDASESQQRRRGMLIDDTHMYSLDFGFVTETDSSSNIGLRIVEIGDAVPHGAIHDGEAVCPVVRFVNARDADESVVGEVEPLINLQMAINEVNFDRLIVSRFGAFPQKVISGWSGTADEVLAASAMRVWSFEDEGVKAQSLAPAPIAPYNELLTEMMEHVAMVAQISPAQVTGKMINVSADALAASEANQQRKLVAKREGFGESWEQVLQLAAEMDGDPATAADTEAEVTWRDTEARSFGSVVDGIMKLSSQGIPITSLLTMIPGMTQQTILGIREDMRVGRMADVLAALKAGGAAPDEAVDSLMGMTIEGQDLAIEVGEPAVSEMDRVLLLKEKLEALGIGGRATATYDSLVRLLELDGLEFTGGSPVSVRLPEAAAAGLEEK